MADCTFCKIVSGEIEAHVIYKDNFCVAFLDKHPINPGHLLLIPNVHEPDFYKLEVNQYIKLMLAVKKLSDVLYKVEHPRKVGIIIAGWDIPHAHVHIIPMRDYHDITSKSLLEGKRSSPSDDELKIIADNLKNLVPDN